MRTLLVFIILFWVKGLMAQNLFRSSSLDFENKVELLPEDPTVIRKRGMEIDTSNFFKSLGSQEPLTLNLFSDVEIQASIKQSRPLADGGSFTSGQLEDGGFMTLMIHQSGIIRGKINSARGIYTIRSDRDSKNQVIIREVDASQILQGDDIREANYEEIESFVEHFQPENYFQSEAKRQTLPENSTVDVLVFYTTRAKVSEGGTVAIEATITAEVEDTNQALRESGLTNRQINLVGMKEINYTQSSLFMGDDLDRLKWNSEDHPSNDPTGIMDEVHKLRDQYGADLVHLFVRDSTAGICGVATIYTQRTEELVKNLCEIDFPNNPQCVSIGRHVLWSDSRMFSVSAVKASCLVGYTFTHELGHSMGLFHDRYTEIAELALNYDSNNGTVNFPFIRYGFGYVNQNFHRAVCWHTIMAYSLQCVNEGFTTGNRTLYFSNPSLSIGSDPVGISGSYRSTSLTGPVDATTAIDDVWDDILIHLRSSSDSCKNAVFSDLEEDTITSSFEAGVQSFTLSDVPDYCADNNLTATSSETFIIPVSRKITNSDDTIDFQIDLTLDENNTCSERTGQVTLTGEAGAEKILSVEQSPSQARLLICENAPSQQLGNLVSVDLSSQDIPELKSFFFDSLNSLEELDLSKNQIDGLTNNIFSTLTSLIELNLSENNISSIRNNAFYNLSALEELDLSRNQISSVNATMFSSLGNLEELDLSHNKLSTLQSSTFSSLTNLEELDLKGNQISSVSQSLFTGLNNLEELDLSRNQISSIPQDAFSQLSKLRYLWLSSNSISTLPSNVFSNLSKLRSLSLDDNELTSLPSGIFSNLSRLRYLWLNANKLTTFPDNIFSGLTRLKYLNLSYNSLTTLSDGVCTFLRNLRHLVIEGSSLDAICPPEEPVNSLLKLFQDFVSLRNPFAGPPSVNGHSSQGLAEVEYNQKVILKLYENNVNSSHISEITGLSEPRVIDMITKESIQ